MSEIGSVSAKVADNIREQIQVSVQRKALDIEKTQAAQTVQAMEQASENIGQHLNVTG